MAVLLHDVQQVDTGVPRDPDFPHAQAGWTAQDAGKVAAEDGLTLTDEHWQVIRALQEFFSRHEEGTLHVNLRELHDALDERFHTQGGLRHLYLLFPGGPVAQGCRIAGLKAPFIATDTSFGSVA
jgi:TusE/DsrC/DsvC family sulfur relay protein